MDKLKSHKTVEQIAKKYRLDVSFIQKQLDMGEPIEHEHTKNHELATYIALQHLDEIPDYYTRLKKMEASAKKEHKKFKDFAEEKKGLWDNIHARRKKGLSPKKPGEKGYPKTLDIEEGLKQARKNVGASKCWTGKKIGNPPTKLKNGREVPNCVPEQNEMIRYCPKCKKNESRSECSYGVKYWDMYSLPVNLGPKKYDPNKPHPANEEKDHEYSMARSEISTIISAAKRLKKKVGKGEGNIEAWVQSKITKAADYLDSAADYLDSGEHKVDESTTIEDSNGNSFAEIIDIIGPNQIEPVVDEACWKGYKQVGMKKKDKKVVPNCVPEQKTFYQFMEDWQRVNKQDKTDGMSQKAVNAYRRENPGSKLKTAVTEKNPGPGRSKRRRSFCSRSKGQQDMHNIDCSKTPDKAICKARRRWRC